MNGRVFGKSLEDLTGIAINDLKTVCFGNDFWQSLANVVFFAFFFWINKLSLINIEIIDFHELVFFETIFSCRGKHLLYEALFKKQGWIKPGLCQLSCKVTRCRNVQKRFPIVRKYHSDATSGIFTCSRQMSQNVKLFRRAVTILFLHNQNFSKPYFHKQFVWSILLR